MQTLKDFEIINKLGEGSFGQVFKVRRKQDKQIYVMKQINISKMNQRMKNEALNEVTILSKLDNQYIVKYYDSFIDKQVLCIIMEYCESGDLHRFLKGQQGRPLTENVVWKFLIQVCLGLTYLHRSKILHRDIKSMNIFLCREQQVRIGDLGVAKVLSDQNNFAKTMVGTPYYLSPEMCEEKPYNEKSDIWALGCVLYELCTLKYPFEANNQGALILKIIRGKYEPISNKIYSPELIRLVESCLEKDYLIRPTAYDLLQKQSLIQNAKTLQVSLNLQQPHPQSVHYKQIIEPKQLIQPEKPKIINPQVTDPSKALLPEKPKIPTSQVIEPQKAVVRVDQGMQVAQKPTFESESKIKNIQQPNQPQVVSNRYQPETPQPSTKKEVQQVAISQKLPIKSSGFNLIKPDAQPQLFAVQQKGMDYQNMYQDWKDKCNDIQKQPQTQDQVKTVNNKQAIQPTKKPVTQKVQSVQSTPTTSKPKILEQKSEQIIESVLKPKPQEQKSEQIQEKKRIRKGAPQDLSRKAQQAAILRPPILQAQQQEQDIAQQKLRLLKDKKAKERLSIAQQNNKDIEEVVNLPDKVKQNRQSVEIQKTHKPLLTNDQQSEVEDIEDFFNDHIQRIKEEKKQDDLQTVRQSQSKSETQTEDTIYHQNDQQNAESSIDQQKQTENSIPTMENDQREEQFEQEQLEEELENQLIMFDEEENQENDDDNDLDQEAYYEEQQCDDDEYNVDTYTYENHQAGIVKSQTNSDYLENFNQFHTIKEDPHEYEQTKQYPQEDENQDLEEQDFTMELIIDNAVLELNKKLLEKQKRKQELQMLMQSKQRECLRDLGQEKFNEIIQFFRKKLNSEDDLDEQDQEEIDDVIQNKFNQKNPQIIYIIYKILHFEIEMDKCDEKIKELIKELEKN